MNFVSITGRLPAGKRPIHLMPLTKCLEKLGVKKVKKNASRKIWWHVNERDESLLWDLFEESRRCWLNKVKKLHPDKGGTHESCAVYNAVWARARELFIRRGIGV